MNRVILDMQPGCTLDAANKVLRAIGRAFPESTVSNAPGTAMRVTVETDSRKRCKHCGNLIKRTREGEWRDTSRSVSCPKHGVYDDNGVLRGKPHEPEEEA